ncbi:tyrosine-type recombinase/integrase [Yoonia sediminilitoris]|uniref:Phage integrase family protein n=1 Tax=Yoonia sediminilitoris TaxID=1286148 RepID=A0A2T6K4N4_9RHOB|nr:tyrosine-type recombinase/integrase [Yoonia sediminilitoris]PUB09597.1 phage integrase family protein [Yoonia sediminilitoris]RCW89519.1 phage integrase family protein [Yoonia sediminilitoris]
MSLVLPRTKWPRSDREMWEALCREAGPLDDPGGLAHLRQTSRNTLEVRYGRWIKWLSDTDPKALLAPPPERATMLRLQSWLEGLNHTKPMSRLMFVDGVLRVLREFAPEQDWTVQRRLLAGLKRAAGRGDPARKNGRILCSAVLLAAGLRHAGLYADEAVTPLERLKRQRDGTMIALLSVLPIRRRSFCELALGQSVHVSATQIMISLAPDMTKTGVPWEVIVPGQVEPVLRHYINEVRPALLARGGQSHNVLWVGKKGEIMTPNYIGSRVGKLTLQMTGIRVPPHFFRDAAATTLARSSAQSARLIRPVLAHSGFKTAERHYIHAQTIDAGRDYASLIKRLKGDRP